MAKSGYSVSAFAAVALVAATAKTVLGVKAGATFGLDLVYVEVSFDGVTPSAIPVLVELCACTFATNAPGTASTTRTPTNQYGRQLAHGTTAASNWTTEPTVLTVLDDVLLTPNAGVIKYDWPLGRSPDCALGEGFAIRCTAPVAVNVRANLDWERC